MNLDFCDQLIQTLDQIEQLPVQECRATILKGNERVFSAGIDLKQWLDEPPTYVEPFMLKLEELFQRVFSFKKPIVACMHGAAIAGGCMLAAACDFRVLGPAAQMGILESRLGVPLPMTAIEIMRHVANPNAFRQITSVGATFVGQAAVDAGLADKCVDNESLLSAASAAADELAAIPPAAFQLTKLQRTEPVLRIVEQNRIQLLARYLEIWNSPETRDAIRQYVDERLR